jgi:Acetyltransferase (GNAT) domain
MNAAPVFQVRTTNELKPFEITALAQLFEVVFGKRCPEDLFVRKFARSPMGHGIHSLMFLNGELIGAFSAIPVRYRFFGNTLTFAITADLMIQPKHRGPVSRVQKLANGLYDALTREGVAFVFCCLRDQVFQLHHALSGWQAIGKVSYYAAPSNVVARSAVRAWNRRAPQPPDLPYEIAKIADTVFTDWRYGIFPTRYTTVNLSGGATAIYAIDLYYPITGIPRQLRTGILIDVSPLNKVNFDAAVRQIREQEPRLKVLAYQGYLRFQPSDIIRIPAKYEKQPWTLGGKILIPEQLDVRIFDLNNWNINLSNGDLV